MLLQILVLYGLEDSRCCATLRENSKFPKSCQTKREKKPNGYQQEQKTITILHHQLLTPIINTKNIIGYLSKEIK